MGQNSSPSMLDGPQIIKRTFDATNDAIRTVPAETTSFTVELDATDGDSVLSTASTDGTSSGTLSVIRADANGRLDTIDGRRVSVSATPTIDTNAYSANDQVGGLQTLASAVRTGIGTCILESITILDKAAQSAAIQVLFFNASPTIASSNNAAIDITDAEMVKFIGSVTIAATDYVTTASNSASTTKNIQLPLAPASGTSLFAVAKTTGTPTYGSASDLIFTYNFKQG